MSYSKLFYQIKTNPRIRARIIGELAILAIVCIGAIRLGIGTYTILAMFTYIFGKFAFNKKPQDYLHLSNKQCLVGSLALFPLIALLTVGVSEVLLYGTHQPMLPIVISVGVCLVWAIAGDIQADVRFAEKYIPKLQSIIKTHEIRWEKVNNIRLENIAEEKLLEIAHMKDLDSIETQLLKAEFIDGLKPWQLHAKFHNLGVPRNVDYIRQKARQKFEMDIGIPS